MTWKREIAIFQKVRVARAYAISHANDFIVRGNTFFTIEIIFERREGAVHTRRAPQFLN